MEDNLSNLAIHEAAPSKYYSEVKKRLQFFKFFLQIYRRIKLFRLKLLKPFRETAVKLTS